MNFSAQQEILTNVKESVRSFLEDEAKEKNISIKKLLTSKEGYDIDDDEHYKMAEDEFIEELAMRKINTVFKNLNVLI